MPTEYTTLGEPTTGSLNYTQEAIVEPMVTVGPRTDIDLNAYYGQTDLTNLGAATTANYASVPQTSTAQYATTAQAPNYATNYATNYTTGCDPSAQYATTAAQGAPATQYYYPTTNYQQPAYESTTYQLPYDPCAQYYSTQQSTGGYMDPNGCLPMGSRVVAEYILGYGTGDATTQQITQQTTQNTTQILEKDISAK